MSDAAPDTGEGAWVTFRADFCRDRLYEMRNRLYFPLENNARVVLAAMTSARIRAAHAADADALHELHNAAWREAYTGLVPESVFAAREQRGSERWLQLLSDPDGDMVWLAHRDGAPVGFAHARACGTEGPRSLSLQALYLRASEYGSGTAANLLQLAVGDAPCFLWVAKENGRALAFYRKHGFEPDGAEDAAAHWGGLAICRMVR